MVVDGHRGRWWGALLAAFTVFACSCGSSEGDVAPAEQAAHRPARTPPEEVPAQVRERLSGWRPPRPEWLAPFRARIDARAAGWPTEHAALAVERELGPALAALLEDELELASWIDEGFEGATRLVPESSSEASPEGLRVRFDAGGVRVLEGVASAELHDGEALAAQLALWRAALGGRRPRVECRVVAIERRADGAFDTEVIVRVVAGAQSIRGAIRDTIRGAGEQAPVLQDLVRWRAAFAVSADGRRVRVKRIELLSFARTEAAAPLFDEVTRAAFGSLPRFDELVLRGNEARLGVVDQLADGDLVGSHGVAIGDVDGDGREDVYVAQPAGLPNLLFLRNADGTAREAGPGALVGFLDSTFGVLIVDLDGDGARDIVAAVSSGVVVAWNEGGTRFRTQRLPSTLAYRFYSLAAADADGDGDLDLYACRYLVGAYVDQGGTDQVPTPYHDAQNGAPNVFWRNDGERAFVDATAAFGFDVNNTRFSLSALWEDLDSDGDLDLYVTNDFGRNNLYRNDGGTFTDIAGESGAADMAASMGATMADVDGDGDNDLVVSNMFAPAGLRVTAQDAFLPEHPELRPLYRHHARGNSLLLNVGGGRFRDATERAGIAPGGWSWGTKFIDFNNDGLGDLYVPNGFVSGKPSQAGRLEDLESYFWRTVVGSTPAAPPPSVLYENAWKSLRELMVVEGYGFNGRERNYAYLNLGGGRFADVSAVSGADFRDDGRCATTLDWDGDGRTDLCVRNRTGPGLRLLRNAFPQAGAFLELELQGRAPNPDAVGAHVELQLAQENGGTTYRRTVYAGDGYLGSSSKRLHFGLGDAQRVSALCVTWPDGSTQAFENLAANRRYRLLQEGELKTVEAPAFATLAVETLRGDTSPPARIVLADRLPMADIPLPLVGGGTLRIGDLCVAPGGGPGGGPVVIVIGTFTKDPARTELAALFARTDAWHETGAHVIVVTMGEDAGGAAARALLAPRGLPFHVVPGDQDVLKTLQLMLLETFGAFDGLALPIVFVLDGAANLAAIHQAPLVPAAVTGDVAAATALLPEARVGHLDPLSGGRWLQPPRRSLRTVADVFRILGKLDLARRYEELARDR